MTSPTKANANGMIQPVASPLPSQVATSHGSDGASPQAKTSMVDAAAAMATHLYLPDRAPIGPIANCTEPGAKRENVTTIEAAPIVVCRSAAICGSSES